MFKKKSLVWQNPDHRTQRQSSAGQSLSNVFDRCIFRHLVHEIKLNFLTCSNWRFEFLFYRGRQVSHKDSIKDGAREWSKNTTSWIWDMANEGWRVFWCRLFCYQNWLQVRFKVYCEGGFFGNKIWNQSRHIDTAYHYQNEAEVGRAINFCITSGLVKREDIFLTTKSGFQKCSASRR